MKTRSCGGTAMAVVRRERRGNRLVERGRRRPAVDERHYLLFIYFFFVFPFLFTPLHGDAHLIRYYYYYYQYFIFVINRCAFSMTAKKKKIRRLYLTRAQYTFLSPFIFFYRYLANDYLRLSLSFARYQNNQLRRKATTPPIIANIVIFGGCYWCLTVRTDSFSAHKLDPQEILPRLVKRSDLLYAGRIRLRLKTTYFRLV